MAKTPGPIVPADFPIRGWFADSHPGFRREILALAHPKSYAVGSVVYQAGDVGRDVFGISAGVVTLQCRFTHADLPSEIPASQTELAMLCNVSRNTFSRVVKELTSRRSCRSS